MPEQPPALVVHESKPRLLSLVGLGVLLTIASVFVSSLGGLRAIVGTVGGLFFGIATLVIARRLVAPGPALVLDAEGIRDLRASKRLISWPEVTAAAIQVVNGQDFVSIWLAAPESYWVSMPWYRRMLNRLNPSMGFGHVGIGVVGLRTNVEEIHSYILRMKPNLANEAQPGG